MRRNVTPKLSNLHVMSSRISFSFHNKQGDFEMHLYKSHNSHFISDSTGTSFIYFFVYFSVCLRCFVLV